MIKNKKVSLQKNYIYNILYQILTVIVPLITTPYVSRVLGPEKIGEYSYTFSIVAYFNLFGMLGINTYGQLKAARVRDHAAELNGVFWEVNICRLLSMLISVLFYMLLLWNSREYGELYGIFLVYLIAGALDISWFFQGIEEFRITVARNAIIKILSTICIFVFVKEKSDFYLYVFILQASTLFGNLLLIPCVYRFVSWVNVRDLKLIPNWFGAISYFIPTVATTIYKVLDKSMLGWIAGSSLENGFYEQANKIVEVLLIVLISIKTVVLPRVIYLFNNQKRQEGIQIVNKSLRFVLILACPMMFGTFLLSDDLAILFLGSEYEKCGVLLKILSLLFFVQSMNTTIGFLCLTADNKQRYFNYGVIAGSVVNLTVNLILIPNMRSEGAAIASVIAESIILLLFIYFGKDLLYIKELIGFSFKYLGASAVMYIVLWYMRRNMERSWYTVLFLVLAGAVFYLIALVIEKDAMLKDVLKRFVKKGSWSNECRK